MKWRSLEESGPYSDVRPLREQFAERKELIAKYVPPETQATHARAVDEIKASGIEGRILPVGATAPEFTLPDQNARQVSSAQLLSQGKLIVVFIRGRWCPFCCGQAEALNFLLPHFREAGANLIAISPQIVKQSYFMHDQHKLRFPLLSDAGNQVARQFGLVYRIPHYQEELYRKVMVNLPFTNGDESWELPIPATYVLAQDGTVEFASASADYTERPEPVDVLKMVETGINGNC
jgi:peroxiredoxin